MLHVGEWDGAGAVVKTRLRNEQLRNPARMLQNAGNVVAFLEEELSGRIAMSHPRFGRDKIYRYFHHVAGVARQECDIQNSDCEPIPGSRSFHSISSVSAADPTQLVVRNFSCFCAPCIAQDWDSCINKTHVDAWLLRKLLPKNPRVIRRHIIEQLQEADDSQFGGDSEAITDDLHIGTNFAVRAEDENDEGVLYYLLSVVRPRFRVEVPFTCVWGNEFVAGEYAIEGMYYQKFGRNNSHNYVWLTGSQPAYIHAESVKATDFPMIIQNHRVSGGDATYKLLEEHHQLILLSLAE